MSVPLAMLLAPSDVVQLISIALSKVTPIAQFKHIGNFQNGAKKEEVKAEPVVEAAPVVEEENLVDDLELVAVITAAIAAASETESADGLVIRSIIRR